MITQKPAILIVDDDQEFAESLVDILSPAGYETVIADRAETAALALQRFLPPVAMLDIRLGRGSGVDLLSHFREHRPDLICVMMTAHADTQSAIAAMRQGAYDYFDKSSDPVELLAVLARCFEKVRLQEERRAAHDALRIAKEAAEKANRSKSEFLANISHELRTPLNAIIGFSEVMIQGMLGPVGNANYEGYLKDIHDSGLDLLNIINDVLDLSKAEAGKLELSEQTVDVASVLDAVCRLMTAKIDHAKLAVTTELAPNL
ncbi:MAG: response regulator, partial [Stellaceae bacterium]